MEGSRPVFSLDQTFRSAEGGREEGREEDLQR